MHNLGTILFALTALACVVMLLFKVAVAAMPALEHLAPALAVGATIVAGPFDGWPGALLAQPAAWCTPLAFATAYIVSVLTPRHVPPRTAKTLVRLHTPERVREP